MIPFVSKKKFPVILLSVFALVTLAFPAFAGSHMKDEPTASIEIKNWRVGFILGYAGGSGTLNFKGESHDLRIKGLRVGAAAGIAKASLTGEVYNLTKLEDIEGTYSAGAAAVAVAAGGKVWTLENSKGVIIKVRGKQRGLELALDMSGMSVKLQ